MMPLAARQFGGCLRHRNRRTASDITRELMCAVSAERQFATLVRQRYDIGLLLGAVEFHPGGGRESLAGHKPQTGAGRHGDALATGQLGTPSYQRCRGRHRSRGAGIILVRSRIQRQAASLAELQDQRLVDIESGRRVAGRSRGAVTVIDVELVALGASGKLWYPNPEKSQLVLRIIALKMKLERCLIVVGDDSKIRAVGLGVSEVAEIGERQSYQHRHVLWRTGYVGAGRRQREIDFLAVLPIAVPPRGGGRRQRRKAGDRRDDGPLQVHGTVPS